MHKEIILKTESIEGQVKYKHDLIKITPISSMEILKARRACLDNLRTQRCRCQYRLL